MCHLWLKYLLEVLPLKHISGYPLLENDHCDVIVVEKHLLRSRKKTEARTTCWRKYFLVLFVRKYLSWICTLETSQKIFERKI